MKSLVKTIIAVFFIAMPIFAQSAQKKPSVVVMPFDAKGEISPEDSEIITEEFMNKYAVAGSSTVVNRSTLSKIQAELKFQNSDWSDSNKTARLGEALNAQQIVSGQLRLYNNLLFAIVQLQDIKTLAVLASVNVRAKDAMELLDKIPEICKGIASQIDRTLEKGNSNERAKGTKWKLGDTGPGEGTIFRIEPTTRTAWEYKFLGTADFSTAQNLCKNYRGGGVSDWNFPSESLFRDIYTYQIYPLISGEEKPLISDSGRYWTESRNLNDSRYDKGHWYYLYYSDYYYGFDSCKKTYVTGPSRYTHSSEKYGVIAVRSFTY